MPIPYGHLQSRIYPGRLARMDLLINGREEGRRR